MSRAFPKTDVISTMLHREPWGETGEWLCEERVYEAMPLITPDEVTRSYFAGKLLVWRQVPQDVLWLRPADADWRRGWKDLVDSIKLRRG